MEGEMIGIEPLGYLGPAFGFIRLDLAEGGLLTEGQNILPLIYVVPIGR